MVRNTVMGFIDLAPYAGRPSVMHNDLRLYVFLSNIAHTGGSVWLRSTESPAALVRGVLPNIGRLPSSAALG